MLQLLNQARMQCHAVLAGNDGLQLTVQTAPAAIPSSKQAIVQYVEKSTFSKVRCCIHPTLGQAAVQYQAECIGVFTAAFAWLSTADSYIFPPFSSATNLDVFSEGKISILGSDNSKQALEHLANRIKAPLEYSAGQQVPQDVVKPDQRKIKTKCAGLPKLLQQLHAAGESQLCLQFAWLSDSDPDIRNVPAAAAVYQGRLTVKQYMI